MPRGSARLRTSDGKFNGIGERVRSTRKLHKLSQDALCARLAEATGGEWNADRRDIFRIEDGRRGVYDTEVIALAKALDVGACWLLTGHQESDD
jgi:transcriptional regulator with XRE-family HTH domain